MGTAEKINSNFKGKDILSLDQFSVKDVSQILKIAKEMKSITLGAKPSKFWTEISSPSFFMNLPAGHSVHSPLQSKNLGGQTLEILDPHHFSSVAKGETLEDTIRGLRILL